MKFSIRNRFNSSVIFEAETDNFRLAVEAAIKIGACLSGACLSGAYLRGADLRSADLSGADLSGAYLSGAYLSGADLSGAYLSGADLSGATIGDGINVVQAPIAVAGLAWPTLIWDNHMRIGCELHSHADWAGFTVADWVRMGGKDAADLKKQHYPALKILCAAHARKAKTIKKES